MLLISIESKLSPVELMEVVREKEEENEKVRERKRAGRENNRNYQIITAQLVRPNSVINSFRWPKSVRELITNLSPLFY